MFSNTCNGQIGNATLFYAIQRPHMYFDEICLLQQLPVIRKQIYEYLKSGNSVCHQIISCYICWCTSIITSTELSAVNPTVFVEYVMTLYYHNNIPISTVWPWDIKVPRNIVIKEKILCLTFKSKEISYNLRTLPSQFEFWLNDLKGQFKVHNVYRPNCIKPINL